MSMQRRRCWAAEHITLQIILFNEYIVHVLCGHARFISRQTPGKRQLQNTYYVNKRDRNIL